MGLLDQLSNVLQNYTSGSAVGQPPADVHQHFDQVAQAAPQGVLAEGLSAAFRSNQTPAFGEMLTNLFNNSSGEQKAGLVNQLLASAGPGALAALGGGGLSSLLQGGAKQVTPEQAAQVSPQAIQQLAAHAEQQDPSIIDKASAFYAAHPTLVKTLGGVALSVALSKVAQRSSQA